MSINLCAEAEVIQVITWEEKHKFFSDFDWPTDGEYDMVYVALPEKVFPSKERYSSDRRNSVNGEKSADIFSLMSFLFLHIYHRLGFGKKHQFNPFVPYTAIPMWIKRPHSFKEGDSIKMNVGVMLCR